MFSRLHIFYVTLLIKVYYLQYLQLLNYELTGIFSRQYKQYRPLFEGTFCQ